MASVLLIIAVPVFFLSIAVEYLYARRLRRSVYDPGETLTNLLIGMGSEITGVVVGAVKVVAYTFAYRHLRVANLTDPVLIWVLALVGVDFCYYWYHRMGHEVNVLWTLHVVHHQSEEYNYAVALRQSWFSGLAGWVFYLPLAVLGIPPAVFATSMVINLLYQFFVHTRLVGRLGPLEAVFNTPSHHRVHHGTNGKYLDKNYGGILIVWDRLFGTFTREAEEPDYGIVKPWTSACAFAANLQPLRDLWRGWQAQKGYAGKWKYLLMPPGWEAADSSRAEVMRRDMAAAQGRVPASGQRKSTALKPGNLQGTLGLFFAAMAATVVVMAPLPLPSALIGTLALAGMVLIFLLGRRLDGDGQEPAAVCVGQTPAVAAVKEAVPRPGVRQLR